MRETVSFCAKIVLNIGIRVRVIVRAEVSIGIKVRARLRARSGIRIKVRVFLGQRLVLL